MIVQYNTIKYLLDAFKNASVVILEGNEGWKFYHEQTWDPHTTVKRILLLKDANGNSFLAINPQGSHFTGEGNQRMFTYAHEYWDNVTSYVISAGVPK